MYRPKPISIAYPQIKVFVPFMVMQPATAISLIGYNYIPVETPISDPFSYSKYFKKRWEEKEKFINVENDIVVWPGAIEAIWDCPQEWCIYNAHLPVHRLQILDNEINGIPMCCMKVSREMIEKTQGLWDEPIKWDACEVRIIGCGIKPHQHFPGIVNANPALLGFAEEVK